MAVPVYTTGQVLAASDCNTWFVPVVAVKPSDQSLTSNVTLTNDTALVIPVAANRTYEIDMELYFLPVNSSTTPGIQFAFTAPAGVTMTWRLVYSNAAGNGALFGTLTTAGGVATLPGPGLNIGCASVRGNLTVAGTAGNLQLQWAQALTSATSTTVKAGSFLTARAIA